MLARGPFSILPAVSAAEERAEERARAAHHLAAEDRRAHALLRLLPPLVHRLNNALAVVHGVHELGAEVGGSERELARRGLAHLGQVLARLALFSRPPAARPELVEVEALFRTHELLLAPLAESLRVEFLLRAEGTGAQPVEGRLEGVLLAACAALLARDDPTPRRRLCLSARTTPRELVLALGSTGSRGFAESVAALQSLARELGWRQRVRSGAGASVLCLGLPATSGARASVAAACAPSARRVLLLHGADVERELVCTLLRENGWSVSASAEEPHTGAFDLALVERRLALADPSLPARVRARFALERVELLEPRMRPGAVLALLGG